jgi:hypothetical protein
MVGRTRRWAIDADCVIMEFPQQRTAAGGLIPESFCRARINFGVKLFPSWLFLIALSLNTSVIQATWSNQVGATNVHWIVESPRGVGSTKRKNSKSQDALGHDRP